MRFGKRLTEEVLDIYLAGLTRSRQKLASEKENVSMEPVAAGDVWEVNLEWGRDERLPDGTKRKIVEAVYRGPALVASVGSSEGKAQHLVLQWIDEKGIVHSVANFTTEALVSKKGVGKFNLRIKAAPELEPWIDLS